jgi:hypothetical protein
MLLTRMREGIPIERNREENAKWKHPAHLIAARKATRQDKG